MVERGKEQLIIPVCGGSSEFERKRAAWLAVHPRDEQGALDYASQHQRVSDSELWRDAMKQAGGCSRDMIGIYLRIGARAPGSSLSVRRPIVQFVQGGSWERAAPHFRLRQPPYGRSQCPQSAVDFCDRAQI